MKNLVVKQLLFTLIIFILFSCSKEENNQSLVNYAATVDNIKFEAASYYAKATYSTITKKITIQGQNQDQTETISFEMSPLAGSSDWKEGSYNFEPNSNYTISAKFVLYDGTSYSTWVSNWTYVKNGSISIQYFSSKRIRGIFAFDLVKQNSNNTYDNWDLKKVTAGSFDLEFNK